MRTDDAFAFGSEIRQLLPFLGAIRADARIVSEFLLTGTLVQSADTFFDGVHSLPPGHCLTCDLKTDALSMRCNYDLAQRAAEPTDGDPVEGFRRLFEEAIRMRLRSDVRVGTCLLEVTTTGLPALLRYEDKNAMAFGIEARLPFLDHRLVERGIALAPGAQDAERLDQVGAAQGHGRRLAPRHRLAAQQDRLRGAGIPLAGAARRRDDQRGAALAVAGPLLQPQELGGSVRPP